MNTTFQLSTLVGLTTVEPTEISMTTTTQLSIALMGSTTIDPIYYSYLPVPLPQFITYLCVSLCVLGFFAGAAGNVFVVLAIARTKKLRNSANVFLASLAVADFGTCVLVLPILFVAFLSLEFVITNQVLCRLLYHTTFTFSPVSIQHLILIAANRCTLINASPRTYTRLFNKRSIPVIISIIWTVNIIFNLLVAVYSYGTLRFFGRDYCRIDQNNVLGTVYWMFTLLYTFLSCFVIIPAFYVLTFRTIHKSQARVKQEPSMPDFPSLATVAGGHHRTTDGHRRNTLKKFSQTEIKLTKVNFFIFLTSMVFISPLFFVMVANGGILTHGLFVMILLPIGINSTINPLVYCGFNRNFRQAFQKILHL